MATGVVFGAQNGVPSCGTFLAAVCVVRNGSMATPAGRVLLAEDNADLRALLQISLSAEGHEVVSVASGLELISCFLACPFVDVVISDVRMPELNGLEVLERFRCVDANTPFILITAFGNRSLHEEAHRLGASAVLDKPFDPDELGALVRRLVSPRRREGSSIGK